MKTANLFSQLYLWWGLVALLSILLLYVLIRTNPSRLVVTLGCAIKRFFRRWSWAWLLLLGLVWYPVQFYLQVRHAAQQAGSADAFEAASATAAKMVDPDQLYSKLSIAAGLFCFINLCAWGALCMVVSVLPNWAKGEYSQPGEPNSQLTEDGLPVVPDFKHSFLLLNAWKRLLMYFLFFALEIYAAQSALEHAFRIQ